MVTVKLTQGDLERINISLLIILSMDESNRHKKAKENLNNTRKKIEKHIK